MTTVLRGALTVRRWRWATDPGLTFEPISNQPRQDGEASIRDAVANLAKTAALLLGRAGISDPVYKIGG